MQLGRTCCSVQGQTLQQNPKAVQFDPKGLEVEQGTPRSQTSKRGATCYRSTIRRKRFHLSPAPPDLEEDTMDTSSNHVAPLLPQTSDLAPEASATHTPSPDVEASVAETAVPAADFASNDDASGSTFNEDGCGDSVTDENGGDPGEESELEIEDAVDQAGDSIPKARADTDDGSSDPLLAAARKVYPTLEELENAIQTWAASQNVSFKRLSQQVLGGWCILACSYYGETKLSTNERRRERQQRGLIKTNCPVRMMLTTTSRDPVTKRRSQWSWRFEPLAEHNHELVRHVPQPHRKTCLTPEVKALILRLTSDGVLPKAILERLDTDLPGHSVALHNIYTYRSRKLRSLAEKTTQAAT